MTDDDGFHSNPSSPRSAGLTTKESSWLQERQRPAEVNKKENLTELHACLALPWQRKKTTAQGREEATRKRLEELLVTGLQVGVPQYVRETSEA
ncbi:hypothetical protein L249_5482, partial [Ophiocordyceps polyrhachis-furcata BCC 54312]